MSALNTRRWPRYHVHPPVLIATKHVRRKHSCARIGL
jgi:hypothetical protein